MTDFCIETENWSSLMLISLSLLPGVIGVQNYFL